MQLISSANRWVVCAFLAISATPVVAKDCRDLLNAPAEQAQLIACTQAALKAVGYDPGKVDGVLNQRTQALISLFQDSERITQDGKPSVALLGRLLKTAPGPVQIADVLAGTSGARRSSLRACGTLPRRARSWIKASASSADTFSATAMAMNWFNDVLSRAASVLA